MTIESEQPSGPRLALVSRGDPLTSYLHAALGQRYPVVADINVELRGMARAAVAAATFRPVWSRWVGRYTKSHLGFTARSKLAGRQLAAVPDRFDVVVQTHALFHARSDATVVYVDCTYREAERGWPAWTPLRGRARERWLRSERELYHAAAHLFAFTTRARDSLIGEYGVAADKVTVVGAGVNFRTAPAALRNETGRDRTILFVGKEFDRKGGHVLLEAFAAVRAELPDVRLQMVGADVPGPLPDGVDLLGVIDDRSRMDELYSRAEVFCLPSLFDPAPLVVLEAMGHGLPCVLSRGSSAHVRDLVDDGHAGWVAETGDAAGLAAGLSAYLRDPALARKVGDAARQAMTASYTWDRVVDRMAPELERISARQLDSRS